MRLWSPPVFPVTKLEVAPDIAWSQKVTAKKLNWRQIAEKCLLNFDITSILSPVLHWYATHTDFDCFPIPEQANNVASPSIDYETPLTKPSKRCINFWSIGIPDAKIHIIV